MTAMTAMTAVEGCWKEEGMRWLVVTKKLGQIDRVACCARLLLPFLRQPFALFEDADVGSVIERHPLLGGIVVVTHPHPRSEVATRYVRHGAVVPAVSVTDTD